MSNRAQLLKDKLKALGFTNSLKVFEKLEEKDAQTIYEICLKDSYLRCTCDSSIRDESFYQAQGHYHHCMLYQVCRAIEISLRISATNANQDARKGKE